MSRLTEKVINPYTDKVGGYIRDINDNLCILISIKSEWVEKILNGEKTIEVRKTCPREFKGDKR